MWFILSDESGSPGGRERVFVQAGIMTAQIVHLEGIVREAFRQERSRNPGIDELKANNMTDYANACFLRRCMGEADCTLAAVYTLPRQLQFQVKARGIPRLSDLTIHQACVDFLLHRMTEGIQDDLEVEIDERSTLTKAYLQRLRSNLRAELPGDVRLDTFDSKRRIALQAAGIVGSFARDMVFRPPKASSPEGAEVWRSIVIEEVSYRDIREWEEKQ